MAGRGTAENLLVDMSNIMVKKRPGGYKLPKSMSEAVVRNVRMVESAQSTNTAAQRLKHFANIKAKDKLLKISTANVPENILPEGCEGVLHDIKVGGYHADDKIYNNHPEIRQEIPRGTTVMDLMWKGSRKETIEDIVIYANRKFSGDIGDEDDAQQPESNDQWKKYFLKDLEEAQQVVCMKKVNGEAAHFSARMIEGQFYIIAGSKNVHMIIKEKNDIDKYVGDRYTVAKVVAQCVWDTLHALEEKHLSLLLNLLHLTKCTIICELLQPENQHIMNLSQLEKPLINAISLTPSAGDEALSSLVALPPHHTLDLLSSLGLPVPAYTVIQATDMQKHRNEIRQGKHGYREEGEVLYFLNEDEETIGLVKTKTAWYIMLRALREKAVYAFQTSRRRQQLTLEEYITSTHKRFTEIQEWLQFSNSYLEEWKKLAKSFLLWMAEEIREERVSVEDIRPKYPVIWEKFLEMTGQTDCVEL